MLLPADNWPRTSLRLFPVPGLPFIAPRIVPGDHPSPSSSVAAPTMRARRCTRRGTAAGRHRPRPPSSHDRSMALSSFRSNAPAAILHQFRAWLLPLGAGVRPTRSAFGHAVGPPGPVHFRGLPPAEICHRADGTSRASVARDPVYYIAARPSSIIVFLDALRCSGFPLEKFVRSQSWTCCCLSGSAAEAMMSLCPRRHACSIVPLLSLRVLHHSLWSSGLLRW